MALGRHLLGIGQALGDIDRQREGVPTLAEMRRKRSEEASALLDTANRRALAQAQLAKLQDEIQAAPGERARTERLTEAQIANLREPNQRPMDPIDRAHKQAQIKQALAEAGLTEAKTKNPDLFRAERAEPRSRNPIPANIGGKNVMIDPETHEVIAGISPPTSAAERTEIANLEQIGEATTGMREAMAKSGWVSRTPGVGSVTRKVREFTGSAGPEADFDFAANRAQQIIYALSGKQINEAERAQLLKLIPNITHGAATEREIERFEDYLQTLIAAKRGAQPFTQPSASPGAEPAEDALLKKYGY
jgi:hypothetical protein